jgi:hypothetical protein
MVELGVIVRVVPPDALFLAYQKSTTDPGVMSKERAAPASVYVFPALSVTLLIVTDVATPPPACQPTTIRLPLPVGGIVHVDVGKVCGPQEVTWTRLIAGRACVRLTPQLLKPPGPRVAGLHDKVETDTDATRLIVAVCELVPSVAVTVAL